ncbi:MAG: o-succinylbenzoate synthase [Acidimicrobiales bacterium]|jgi:O-succinylbenzoate synthase
MMMLDAAGGPTTPRRAWEDLGTDRSLILDGAELWWVELPFVRPVATAVGTHRGRPLVLVRLRCRSVRDGTDVDGWGECAALVDATYDAEDVAGAFAGLEQSILPSLGEATARDGGVLPSTTGLGTLAGRVPGRPLSFAALEMAVGDAHMRSTGRSFASVLGVSGATVEPGAVLGVPGSTAELLGAVERLAAAGYARVKVKVAPGTEFTTVSTLAGWAARQPGPTPRFQVDANGSYTPHDADLLVELDRFGLVCIEQPFHRDDLESHRRLAARMSTPICLDESLDGPPSVVDAVTSGACSVVCVKPARLGGLGAALEAIEWCTTTGVPWWIGGMFESGYARRVTTALAALPGPTLPGDVAPPADYLAADLVGPLAGRVDAETGRLAVPVSEVPGMGPVPDRAALEELLVRRVSVPLGR